MTQKVGQISKIWRDQIYILCCSLRVSGHLPAPIVNGGGDRLGKVQFSELQKSCDLGLNLGWGHTAYLGHHSSIFIYTPNFIEIGETFCGRTYLMTDICSPSNVIRSTRRSRPNKIQDKTHPSISDSSWLIVWLAYGCICELVLFAPTVSISSMNIIHGVRILAASAISNNLKSICSNRQVKLSTVMTITSLRVRHKF